MESKSCDEFTVGFCPNEEFNVENITIKCPYSHISAKRAEYQSSNTIYKFEYRVLEFYKEIISEVNKKIDLNLQILSRETLKDEYRNALNECESLIEQIDLNEANFTKIHTLLVLHGRLIENMNENKKDKNFEVCSVCSAFKEINKPCQHKFCSKYAHLREIIARLENKLPKNQLIEEIERDIK